MSVDAGGGGGGGGCLELGPSADVAAVSGPPSGVRAAPPIAAPAHHGAAAVSLTPAAATLGGSAHNQPPFARPLHSLTGGLQLFEFQIAAGAASAKSINAAVAVEHKC